MPTNLLHIANQYNLWTLGTFAREIKDTANGVVDLSILLGL